MTDFFSSPVGMALLAGCCTWAFTAFGAGMVYTAKSFSRRTLDVMLGFAAGVMIAASYWSLLAPALEMSSHLGRLACVPVALGFLAGAGVLRLVDLILPHIHPTENVPDGPPSKLPRSALLVFAITLHNSSGRARRGRSGSGCGLSAPEASIAGAMTLMFGMGAAKHTRGRGRIRAVASGGLFQKSRLLLWAAFRHRRAHSRCFRGAGRGYRRTHSSLCSGFCRRGHDFCGRRRSDSRVPRLRPRRCGQPRRHHRFSWSMMCLDVALA